ncbi:MAG: 16S rRNA (guanine(966)-N(2))-methyltransferase RsmD [Gammaproteobacteria bacterium]|jgi:16S rRNA (guanine966-N2)-methyltransferase|nr:16S rRNA (guanine(966)-N(2))-methyltransferase RsmD [Gammaproteobacteria bacterium]
MNKSKTIRIIGGSLKNSKIRIVEEGIKPTTDRVRVTLFNWLHARIANKRVLDLFAGSGILGLEALSRDSEEVIFIERSKKASMALDQQLAKFQIDNYKNKQVDAIQFLKQKNKEARFDIIFLDPPYGSYAIHEILSLIVMNNWIVKKGYVFYESNVPLDLKVVEPLWNIYRKSKAGKVYYYLLCCN